MDVVLVSSKRWIFGLAMDDVTKKWA